MSLALGSVVDLLGTVVIVYFVAVNGFYLLLMASAAHELRWHLFEVAGESRDRVLSSKVAPSVSMLVPAHNEAATIVDSVRALLSLTYPDLEVVVVDDGSTDGTVAALDAAFDLAPVHPIYRRRIETAPVTAVYRSRTRAQVVVAVKENGGKADALNAALDLATGDLVCALDADTLVEPDALVRLVRPFLRSDTVVAAGATIRIANGCEVTNGRVERVRVPRRPVAGFQAAEYIRAFLFGRLGWNRMGSNLVISGAFGLFRRAELAAAGGYEHGVGEDIELVVRLRRLGYEQGRPHEVEFVPDPVAWTEAPSSLRILGRQRDRWHRGLSDTLWRHRDLLFDRSYGVLGVVVYPVFLIVEWLAPIVEALGLGLLVLGLVTGTIDPGFAVLFFAVAYGLGLFISVVALLLEELSFHRYGSVRDRLVLLGWTLLEPFGYRQLSVVWRLRGILGFLRGDTRWGTMERTGFRAPTPTPPPRSLTTPDL